MMSLKILKENYFKFVIIYPNKMSVQCDGRRNIYIFFDRATWLAGSQFSSQGQGLNSGHGNERLES